MQVNCWSNCHWTAENQLSLLMGKSSVRTETSFCSLVLLRMRDENGKTLASTNEWVRWSWCDTFSFLLLDLIFSSERKQNSLFCALRPFFFDFDEMMMCSHAHLSTDDRHFGYDIPLKRRRDRVFCSTHSFPSMINSVISWSSFLRPSSLFFSSSFRCQMRRSPPKKKQKINASPPSLSYCQSISITIVKRHLASPDRSQWMSKCWRWSNDLTLLGAMVTLVNRGFSDTSAPVLTFHWMRKRKESPFGDEMNCSSWRELLVKTSRISASINTVNESFSSTNTEKSEKNSLDCLKRDSTSTGEGERKTNHLIRMKRSSKVSMVLMPFL